MRKLTKGEKRNIINEIRRYENMIEKLEDKLYTDETSKVLLTATKTIKEVNTITSSIVTRLNTNKELSSKINVSVEHVRYGDKIICTMKYAPKNIEVEGIAICAKDDRFDPTIGMSIAECRATAKLFESIAEDFGK